MTTRRLRLTRSGVFVIVGIIISAWAIGHTGNRSILEYSTTQPTAANAALLAVLADPFSEEHHSNFLGGQVIAYHSASQDRLLLIFNEVHGTDDPSGPRVRMFATCRGRARYLGILAERFFGNPSHSSARNSIVFRGVLDCESVTLSVIRGDGSAASTTVLPVALDSTGWISEPPESSNS